MSNRVLANKVEEEVKRGLMPKLRFPEFRDAPEWEEKRLIDVASKKVKWSFTGGPFGSNLKSSDYTDAGIRIIQLQNIGDGEFIDDWKIFTSEKKADELLSCNIYPGELILSKMGDPVARACLIPSFYQRYVMCSDGIRLVVDKKNYDNYFIYSYINSTPFRRRADKAATGSTRKRIGLDDIKGLSIIVPELAEQQKIADCLSSLDELIAVRSQKLDEHKEHKKGLMQQLFPAEGKTLPQLRFPEFRGAVEWKEKKLGRIGDILMCKRIFTEETNDTEGVPFYKIGTLGSKPDAFISKKRFEEYKSKYKFPRKGEILITCSGTVGKYLPYDGNDAYYQDSNIVWIDNPILEISNEFLLNILLNVNWGKLNSTTITRIYGSDLKNLSILFPPNQNEQRKITNCLSTLDELITAQSLMLDLLKEHKKGMMQLLFPAPEEVRG